MPPPHLLLKLVVFLCNKEKGQFVQCQHQGVDVVGKCVGAFDIETTSNTISIFICQGIWSGPAFGHWYTVNFRP